MTALDVALAELKEELMKERHSFKLYTAWDVVVLEFDSLKGAVADQETSTQQSLSQEDESDSPFPDGDVIPSNAVENLPSTEVHDDL